MGRLTVSEVRMAKLKSIVFVAGVMMLIVAAAVWCVLILMKRAKRGSQV